MPSRSYALLSSALCVALSADATRSSCVGAGGFADGAWVEGGDEIDCLHYAEPDMGVHLAALFVSVLDAASPAPP